MTLEIDKDKLLKGHSENDELQSLGRHIKDVYGLADDEPKDAVEVIEGQRLDPWSIDGKHRLSGRSDGESGVTREVSPEIKSVTSRILRINLGDHRTTGFASKLATTREDRKRHSIRKKAA